MKNIAGIIITIIMVLLFILQTSFDATRMMNENNEILQSHIFMYQAFIATSFFIAGWGLWVMAVNPWNTTVNIVVTSIILMMMCDMLVIRGINSDPSTMIDYTLMYSQLFNITFYFLTLGVNALNKQKKYAN